MIAKIFGKSDVYRFKIEIFGDIKNFDFLRVMHQSDGPVLCQVTNVTRDGDKLIGDCKIIGYRKNRILKNIRVPFENNVEISVADDKFIEEVIGLNIDKKNFIGMIEHHPNLRISLDLKKAITKHIAVLAKSGAGKSYTVGVLLEEVLLKKIPVLILDPHNEYSTIKYPNTDKRDLKRLEKLGLKPKGFLNSVKEFSPDISINQNAEPISLDINMLKPYDLINSFPQKLTPSQQALLYNILNNLNNRVNFDELIFHISNEESNNKWSLISLLEMLKKLNIYSPNATPLNKIVRHGQASIISLKGVEPDVQQIFVAGLLKALFDARKKEEVPPFFLVIEEAHNFCPERSMGEVKSSKIIRTLAAEGRKFGVGICVISQRPAKVDKNVISQCTTQIILKVTNPNDLKSVIASSEGVDSDSENEIQKLNIGTCLLTGLIDIPLKVNIRPRISKHGGETVDITMSYEESSGMSDNFDTESFDSNSLMNDVVNSKDANDFAKTSHSSFLNSTNESQANEDSESEGGEFVQFVSADITLDDAKVLLDSENVRPVLIPGSLITFKTDEGEYKLLIDRSNLRVVKSIFPYEAVPFSKSILSLSERERNLFKSILTLKDKFNPAELLIKTDMMFNEILRLCDSLTKRGILKKVDSNSFSLNDFCFLKKLNEFNFYGVTKFEEIKFEKVLNEEISESDVKKIFSLFGKISSVKDIQILNYVKF